MLADLNFEDIAWPDRLNKSGSLLSQSEGQILIDVMNDHGFETIGAFPNSGEKYIGLNSYFSSWSVSGNTFPRQI